MCGSAAPTRAAGLLLPLAMVAAAGLPLAPATLFTGMLSAAASPAAAAAGVAISSCYVAQGAGVVLKQLSLHRSWLTPALQQPANIKQCRRV
jgi:hypothetical protein